MVTKNLVTTVVGLQDHPVSNIVPTSGQALVFNGTQWAPASVSANLSGTSVGVSVFIPGKPPASQYYVVVVPFPVTINFGDSRNVGQNIGPVATASAVFATGKRSGGTLTSEGSFTVATSGAITFTGSTTTLNAGDALVITAPATQDATLANVSVTFFATRV